MLVLSEECTLTVPSKPTFIFSHQRRSILFVFFTSISASITDDVKVVPQLTVHEREVDIVLLEVLFDCPERVVVLDFKQESWEEGDILSHVDIL